MKLKKMHWFGIIAGVVIILFDVVFFFNDEKLLLFLLGIGFGTVALPFVIGIALEGTRDEKINEMFLEFSRNLAESVATGTPISKGIINMQHKNYGVLNAYIGKLANQIELGIPVDVAFQTFAEDINSQVIKRAVTLIREAEKAGGEIDYILGSTTKSIAEVEQLKKERKAAIYSLVVQGYIIFFIFIGIILVMEFKILPLTVGIGTFGTFTGSVQDFEKPTAQQNQITAEDFTRSFLYLLLAQGFFIGLVIGKLTEGSVKSGLKHSFILSIAAFLISSGARLFAS